MPGQELSQQLPAAPGLHQVMPSSWKSMFVPLQGLVGRFTSSIGGRGWLTPRVGLPSSQSPGDPTCCGGLGVG